MSEIRDSNEILDSWKEIAVFLRRGVRTVQRWEVTEGLPVRRHDHMKRGSVYALRSDLTLWIRTRQFGQGTRMHGHVSQHCGESRARAAEQRAILNELRAQLQLRWSTVLSSWKQLQETALQANHEVPIVGDFVSTSHRMPQAIGVDLSATQRASA
jgi:hypothetical protein